MRVLLEKIRQDLHGVGEKELIGCNIRGENS